MNRTLLHSGGGAPLCSSVRERILSSYHASPCNSRCQQQVVQPASRQRRHQDCMPCCSAGKASKSGKKGSGQGFKGFGEPPKTPVKTQPALTFDPDPNEEELQGSSAAAGNGDDGDDFQELPTYQMYTDAGYKAQRYVGPFTLKQPEDEPLPVLYTSESVLPGDLLAVFSPLGFVAGDFLQVPELEDLHAAMLEDGMAPQLRRVLTILDSLRPGAHPAAVASSQPPPSQLQEPPPQQQQSPAPSSAQQPKTRLPFGPTQQLPSLATLDPKFWSGRGRDTSAPDFPSRRLKALLGRTAIADESQDPACMQARHQKPQGYVGLWPELSLLGHSCTPNTSQLVVADRLVMHAVDELPAGAKLTRNLIGTAVTAPLRLRQSAMAEVLRDTGVDVAEPPAEVAEEEGEGEEGSAAELSDEELVRRRQSQAEKLTYACRCERCRLEAGVSEELRETLESVYNWFVEDVADAWNRANQEEDISILRGLLTECETLVAEVEELLNSERPALDANQKDYLRASVYDAYDLLVSLDEMVHGDGADATFLRMCLQLNTVFQPGSESHFNLAIKHEELSQHRCAVFIEMLQRERGAKGMTKGDKKKFKALKGFADEATELRVEAVVMRYGLVSVESFGKLRDGAQTYIDGLQQAEEMRAQGVSELSREIEVEGVRVQIVDRLEVSEASRVGAGARARRVVDEDGVQVTVVDESSEQQQREHVGEVVDVDLVDVEPRDEVEGAAAEEGEEGEGQWLEVDEDAEIDIDEAVQAAVDAALAEEIEKIEREQLAV